MRSIHNYRVIYTHEAAFQSKRSINQLEDHGNFLKPLTFEKYGGNQKQRTIGATVITRSKESAAADEF